MNLENLIYEIAEQTNTPVEEVIHKAMELIKGVDADTTYTLDELAKEWRCSYRFVWDAVNSGKLKATKIGKSWKITKADKIAFEKKLHYCGKRMRMRKGNG